MYPVHSGRWQRCIVIWTVRDCDYVQIPFFDGEKRIRGHMMRSADLPTTELACEGLRFVVHRTGGTVPRLDIERALKEACEEQSGSQCWSYISGPGVFITSAERACGGIQGLT